jgi:hypothetical protein
MPPRRIGCRTEDQVTLSCLSYSALLPPLREQTRLCRARALPVVVLAKVLLDLSGSEQVCGGP